MKRTKKIVSVILAIALLVGILPVWQGDVKEAEAALAATVPDVIIADANKLYPDAPVGTKLFFPDIANVNGELWVVYYKNDTHARFQGTENFGEIHIVKSTDNGANWSDPTTLVTKDWLLSKGIGTPERPLEGRDPNLAVLNDGTVILTFFTNHNAYVRTDNQTYIVEFLDNGQLGEPVQVAVEGSPIANGSKRGDVAIFEDGSVLFPLQGHDGVDTANTRVSCVLGHRTGEDAWEFTQYSEVTNTATAGTQVDECSFAAIGGDEVIAFIRETGGVYRSTDKGATWTKIADENLENTGGSIINQPGLKLYENSQGEKCLYVTYAVPGTKYGRPIFGKSVKLSDLNEENGWNKTEAQLIYRSPNSAGECADPSSVITSDGKVLVVYYDGDTYSEYIGGTFVNLDGTIPNDGYQYTETNLGDYGIATYADCGSESVTFTKAGDSLDGYAISGIFNFKEGNQVSIGNSGYGIVLMVDKDPWGKDQLKAYYVPFGNYGAGGVEILTITAAGLGKNAIYGEDLDIRMTFKFINKETVSGVEYGDLLFGIEVDDYKTSYFYKDVATWALTQSISAKNAVLKNAEYENKYPKANRLELSDFGIAEEVVNGPGEKGFQGSGDTLIGKTVTGIYNFRGDGATLAFGVGSWTAFGLRLFDDQYGPRIYPYYWNGGEALNTSVAINSGTIGGKNPAETDLKIEAMFDFTKNEADDLGTVTVTLLIDDKYTFTYSWSNVTKDYLQAEGVYARHSSGSGDYTVKFKATDYYGTLTPKDFGVDSAMVLNAGTYMPTDTPNESLDGKVIKGIYKFQNGSGLVFGSNSWYTGSVILNAYDDGSNNYIVIYNSWNIGKPAKPNAVNDYIYHYDLGGKKFIGTELEIEAYFNFRDNVSGGTDLEVHFTIDKQYKFTYRWQNADVTYLKEAICSSYSSQPLTVIEPSAHPNYRLPQALGATLATVATNKDAVRMGFSFADVIANEGIAKENISEYGAVLVAGTKDAATMKAQAESMITNAQLDVNGYKRTQGDIDKLWASESKEYFVTISNSADEENMHIRATAIAYIKLTDGTIYYSSDCNSDQTQRHNKSVYGLLKAIFTELYVKDYDDAVAGGTAGTTPLEKAIAEYNNGKEEAQQTDITKIKAIINSTNKSNEEQRRTLIGVHYAM